MVQKPNQKIRVYDKDGMQLAAYAEGIGLHPEAKLWNVIISSNEAGRVEVADWTEKRQEAFAAFIHTFELWCYLENFDPRVKEQDDENVRSVSE